MLHYEVLIYWDPQDQIYVAEVPDLLGCAAHGDTYEAAIQEAQVAMNNWIKVAQELGRPIPEPSRKLAKSA